MNETIRHQLEHRTIRFFKKESVRDEHFDWVLKVINQTASSNAIQAFSILRITDPEIRYQLSLITKQAYIEKVPELLIFVVDTYRNAQIAKAKNYQGDAYRSMDFFFQGAADCYLAAQNATNAIESLGMGAVYFGSILNDSQKVIDLLKLPELTFPILGLGFGYPDDDPQSKPRMDMKIKMSENTYDYPGDILSKLQDYDNVMQEYYDTRFKNQRLDSFTNQVLTKFENAPELRTQILRVIQSQGFNLNIN